MERPTPAPQPDSQLRSVVIGALVGGALGYLCFTAGGRRLRRRVDAWLDTAADEIRRLDETQRKFRTAVEEGRRAFAGSQGGANAWSASRAAASARRGGGSAARE